MKGNETEVVLAFHTREFDEPFERRGKVCADFLYEELAKRHRMFDSAPEKLFEFGSQGHADAWSIWVDEKELICIYTYWGQNAPECCSSWVCHAFEQKSIWGVICSWFRRNSTPSDSLLKVCASLTAIIEVISDAQFAWYSEEEFFT